MAGQSAQNSKEIITSPSKKRTLSIIAVVFVVLVILALSGYFVKQSSTNLAGSTNMTDAQKQTTVSTQEGDITIKEGELPKDFPEDIAIYENSKVERSTESNSGTTVILQTSDSVGKVTSFYNDNLKNNNWNSIQSSTIEGSSLITAEKDIRQLVITVVIIEKAEKTQISIVVGTAQ